VELITSSLLTRGSDQNRSGEPEDSPEPDYFFLWRFLRRRFFRLCVAILWRLRFLPLGMAQVLIGFSGFAGF
jgi:hypothetical protein